MLFGIVAMILVGVSWTALGYVMGEAPKRKIDPGILLFLSAALALTVSLIVGLLQGLPRTSAAGLWLAIGSLLLGGILNYFQLDLMSRAMQRGPNGIIWSIIQMGFVFPFFMGILFFGVPLGVWRMAGFWAIMVSLLLFGAGPNAHESGKWKGLTLSAFLMTGANQSLSNLPSYFPAADAVSSVWRTAAFAGGLMLAALAMKCLDRKNFFPDLKRQARRRELWRYCLLLEGFELIFSFFLFYPGMDCLSHAGAGAIAYPVMVSSCLIGFELFAVLILREKRTPMQRAALLLSLIGIIGVCS